MLANLRVKNRRIPQTLDSQYQHRAERERVELDHRRRRNALAPAAFPPTKPPPAHGRRPKGMDAAGGESDRAGAPAVDRAPRPSSRTRGGAAAAEEARIAANVAVLESHLTRIAARRTMESAPGDRSGGFVPSPEDRRLSFAEEPSEAILFPDWAHRDGGDGVPRGTEIISGADTAVGAEVRGELHAYVTTIASLYRDVPFHNFEHACHVAASANELLRRLCEGVDDDEDAPSVAARTFGISADPLAMFAVVFASLVHDVDHRGVPNAQLVAEADPLAARYDDRSMAEKRSVSVAWDVLMEDRFRGLRSAIFVDGDGMRRFQRLLVHAVLATDIADGERSARFERRWRTAFRTSRGEGLDGADARRLRAALVLEQIVQASDVAHAMQRWETFVKWNARLYQELAKAHREGRGPSDPRARWYEGEVGFFDGYVVPLAERLEECGALGPAAGECLERARENRRRWGEEGEEMAREIALEDDWLAAKIYASSQRTDGFAHGCFPY